MKMQEIDDFLNRTGLQTGRKQSKLEPFLEEIFELKRRGYSQVVILRFLKECKNIEISQQALNYFIRSRSAQMQTTTITPIQTPKSASTAQSKPIPELSQTQAENTAAANNSGSVAAPTSQQLKQRLPIKGGIKKFDWKNASTDGLI